jgi:hypothetical protein
MKIISLIAPVNNNDRTVIRVLKSQIIIAMPSYPVVWRVLKDYSVEFDCWLVRVCALVDGTVEQKATFGAFMPNLQIKDE